MNHCRLGGLEQQKLILTFLEAGSPKSTCGQGPAPSEGSREESCPFLAPGDVPWLTAASLPSLPLSTGPSSLQLFWVSEPKSPSPFSYKDTSHRIEGPPQSRTAAFNSITSAQALFPNKVIFTDTGHWDGNISFDGDTIQPTSKGEVSAKFEKSRRSTLARSQQRTLSGASGPTFLDTERCACSNVTTSNPLPLAQELGFSLNACIIHHSACAISLGASTYRPRPHTF